MRFPFSRLSIFTVTTIAFALIVISVIILKERGLASMRTATAPIRMAIGGPWISLHPGLQHTVWADIVLSNQFEPLVGMDNRGILAPLAAKSWSISDDLKTYEFAIDSSRMFSDGSPLTAADFKRSWEEALALEPKAANSSLLDVLYSVEGFDEFSKTKTLSGLIVQGTDRLIIRLIKPSRIMLHHLSGNRFAAFKNGPHGPIGTGKYVISELDDKRLKLEPNVFSPGDQSRPTVFISIVPTEELAASFDNDSIDGLLYGRGANLESTILNDSAFKVLPGPEATHHVVHVNGADRRLLADPLLRKAVQFLLLSHLSEKSAPLGDGRLTRVDPQVFLPLQAGRIKDEEAAQLIKEGEKYVEQLRNSSKLKPLVIKYLKPWEWVADGLRRAGVALSPESQAVPYTELVKLFYQTNDFDLLVGAVSVVDGDPDGIYHALGKNGAILCPVAYREPVGKLIEEGRQIIHQSEVDPHYQKIARQVLIDVPFVHLGFSRSVSVIRNDKLEVDEFVFSRMSDGQLDIFRHK